MSKPQSKKVSLKERILALATKQFIRHGYQGVSFLDLAKALGVTHSNIHYYFGTKADLAAAVLDEFAANMIAENRAIWADPETTLREKFLRSRDRYYRDYLRFNPTGEGSKPWALLSRFSVASNALTSEMRWRIRETLQEFEVAVRQGLDLAIKKGELTNDAPIDGLTLQLTAIFYTTGQMTKLEGGFDRVDKLLESTSDSILRAYGNALGDIPAWPKRRSIRNG